MMKSAVYTAIAAAVVSSVDAAHEARCKKFCDEVKLNDKCDVPGAAVYNDLTPVVEGEDSIQACLNECASFPLFSTADGFGDQYDPLSGGVDVTGGNSFECRYYHAKASAANAELPATVHCPHANPSSANADSTTGPCTGTYNNATDPTDVTAYADQECQNYCDTVSSFCPGYLYPSKDVCLAACPNLPKGEASLEFPLATETSGNTLSCRKYHASVSRSNPPNKDSEDDNSVAHCPHATYGRNYGDFDADGAVCGNLCDTYCSLTMGACSGANAVYDDMAQCKYNCEQMPFITSADDFVVTAAGLTTPAAGDSNECRAYHAAVAATDPATHCKHTVSIARNPGSPCGGAAGESDEVIEDALAVPDGAASALAPALTAVAAAVAAMLL